MSELINRKKLVIFDKDGCLVKSVVNPKTGKSHAPNRLEDQDYFEDVQAKCQQLIADGNTLAIASNQGGVAFGIFPADEAETLVSAAALYIGASGYRVCFYHPKGKVKPYDTDSYDRKPAPGMIESLMHEFGYLPQDTIMVGDWETDKQAAQAAGCGFIWAHEFFGRVDPFADRLHAALDVK
jgi:D-glycero-D-manno-heptose 1,7-bisphosphate phosphatase